MGKKDRQQIKPTTKIIIIIVVILFVLTVTVCLICGILAKCYEDTIHLSDWLMAGCTLLSMFGTVILACVSVFQSNKANEINERLFEQNEKLQEINDVQFKIANQDKFPILEIKPYKLGEMQFSIDEANIWGLNETSSNILSIAGVKMWTFLLDFRTNKEVKKKIVFRFSIINKSKYPIKDIKIYRVICSIKKGNITNVYGKYKDVEWSFFNKILLSDICLEGEIVLAFDDAVYEENKEKMNLFLYLEMHTVTGLTFYEKVSCCSSTKECSSNIEEIELTKIMA